MSELDEARKRIEARDSLRPETFEEIKPLLVRAENDYIQRLPVSLVTLIQETREEIEKHEGISLAEETWCWFNLMGGKQADLIHQIRKLPDGGTEESWFRVKVTREPDVGGWLITSEADRENPLPTELLDVIAEKKNELLNGMRIGGLDFFYSGNVSEDSGCRIYFRLTQRLIQGVEDCRVEVRVGDGPWTDNYFSIKNIGIGGHDDLTEYVVQLLDNKEYKYIKKVETKPPSSESN